MISDMIKNLREDAGNSQSEPARRLGISRSSVNAWEMGLSTPTTPYIVEIAKIFMSQQTICSDRKNKEQ